MECQVPVIEQEVLPFRKYGVLQLALRLTQFKPASSRQGIALSSFDLPTYSFTSVNTINLALLPEPTLSSAYPRNVYNLVDLNIIQVYGAEFNGNTVCVFDTSSATVSGKVVLVKPDQVVDDGQLTCSTKRAMKGKRSGHSLKLSVSNDMGRTVSEAIEISFRTKLPRVLRLERPDIIFADGLRVDVWLKGAYLYSGIRLIAVSTNDKG